ncbi:DUF1838 domain-containing protein [Metabacillus litoralis]|uniref:DUF1838 domain-containing protein n=1 Tax=Metabacillus litoralis TaxID=152268 RepID=A0A5C6UZZ4_9BACI|nr:DUF1838 family protein [Metabacillus litoralis]TXC78489.1 DUF1838 domain-containing protein [Metabacillus litoralis]
MGFFKRLFKKVEDVNKGEVTDSNLESEFYLDSSEEEAMNLWMDIAQNIIVNVVKVTNNSVDRAFILLAMKEQPSFDIFYQIDGSLVFWNQLKDTIIKEKIENELLPQASTVASAVNGNFAQVEHPKIAFVELQIEWATGAWFSHIIWEDDDNSSLAKEEILNKWFNSLTAEIKNHPLDSNTKLSWYP